MNLLKIIGNKVEKNWQLINKIEPYIFYVLCVVGVLPLLFSKYFVTLDGPTHLYNANIIKGLFWGQNTEINNLFTINKIPVPNWTGHFIMAFFNLFLPSFLSEKIFLGLYFLLTPVFFRKFILQLYPANKAFTYFIILFVHNHLLYFGFYNLSIGITVLFITCFYFVKYCNKFEIRSLIILSTLLLLIYFSHVFILLISILTLITIILITIKSEREGKYFKISNYQTIINRSKLLAISALPGLILSIYYFSAIDSIEKASRPDLSELFKWIINIRPLLTLCYCDSWKILSHIIFALFSLLIVSNIYFALKENIKFTKGAFYWSFPINISNLWLVVSFVFLCFFLILPNAILLTDRLIVIFYLFLILWIASLKHHKFPHFLTILIIVIVHIGFVYKHFNAMRQLSSDAEKMEQIAQKIEENCLTLTLNYSDNWLHQHISGYLGSNKAIPVLENYEAGLKWFPVQWKTNKYQIEKLNQWGLTNKDFACNFYINRQDSTCFSLFTKGNKICPILYVVCIKNDEKKSDSCTLKIRNVINNYYLKIYANDLCTLYKLKR